MNELDRRSFVASLGSSLGLLALSPRNEGQHESGVKHDAGASVSRPNVIIMICDDLGYGDLGCYGSKLNTPNLNRMASEGARFTRFNTACPFGSHCAPRSVRITNSGWNASA